jgi:hypothetical protein
LEFQIILVILQAVCQGLDDEPANTLPERIGEGNRQLVKFQKDSDNRSLIVNEKKYHYYHYFSGADLPGMPDWL